MASARSLMAPGRIRLSVTTVTVPRCILRSSAATFSTSSARLATPSGPPPPGFRLPRMPRWNEKKESALDQAGRYFLMTEMMRGMYVVLEQFFRPPYAPTSAAPLFGELTKWQVYNILSVRERPRIGPVSRRACFATLPNGRGKMHCLQAMRSYLPSISNYH